MSVPSPMSSGQWRNKLPRTVFHYFRFQKNCSEVVPKRWLAHLYTTPKGRKLPVFIMNTGSFYKDRQHKYGNISGFVAGCTCFSRIKQKSPDFSVETTLLFPLFIKRWFQSCDLHTLCLTNRFVCNFLSSSAGFNLCSCFFRLTLAFRFRFRLSLGLPFHGLAPLPFRFLTPAVSAFFRPLQFWILTTQPLFFLSFSSRLRLTVALPVPASALASSVSPFSPA